MTNEVRVFDGLNLEGGFIGKVQVPDIAAMSISPDVALPIKIAVFVPEAKGRPATVKIVQFPQIATAIASKTFFDAQNVQFEWSPNGAAVLVKTSTGRPILAQCTTPLSFLPLCLLPALPAPFLDTNIPDVDSTGASYYGSTGLYLLHANGKYEAGVATQKEGPISDAKWSPASKGFVVIAGTMPAQATLFDMQAKPVFNFGCAHRSAVSWSPHGRFLCLAGFGNLAGDMDFWDMNKQKKMGSSNSHCAVTHGWSPCSRFFMTATCAPRMNVDNGIKLFRYHGGAPVFALPHEQLFDARWRPAAPGAYPDRAQSPARVSEAKSEAVEVKKVEAYRPPGSSGRLAAMMKAEREGPGPGKIKAAEAAAHGKPTIVGMAPTTGKDPSVTAAKNKWVLKRHTVATHSFSAPPVTLPQPRTSREMRNVSFPEPLIKLSLQLQG